MAFFAILLAVGLGTLASQASAAPFAYVTIEFPPGNVSVIDTATNTVAATVPVGSTPLGVAVTPDGKRAYVPIEFPPGTVSVIDTATITMVATVLVATTSANAVAIAPDGKHAYVTTGFFHSGAVSVIETTGNTVVATVPVGLGPGAVAIAPDGKHAYVANGSNNTFIVQVIDTASNTVVATVPVGLSPVAIAVTPDGTRAYVANFAGSGTVSVIATAGNTVVATVPVPGNPSGIAITPDGKHAYVANEAFNNVSVIDTASNTVVGMPIPVGISPIGVAITPDGKHAYVANAGFCPGPNDCSPGIVSVIDTAANTVVATIGVGSVPVAVAIAPPPTGVPFLAFNAKLRIDLDRKPNKDRFELDSHFTLSSTAPGIHPVVEPVTLQIGTFSITIPPGSFKKHEGENEDEDEHEHEDGFFTFHGVIDGVRLQALIKRTGTLRYTFDAKAKDANLTGTKNPVQVMLTIGGNSGTTSVTADIDH